jgi:hypothetical protein
MGLGERILWLCGFLAVAAALARLGDWLIGGWREIEALDEQEGKPPFGSPRWVRDMRENVE